MCHALAPPQTYPSLRKIILERCSMNDIIATPQKSKNEKNHPWRACPIGEHLERKEEILEIYQGFYQRLEEKR